MDPTMMNRTIRITPIPPIMAIRCLRKAPPDQLAGRQGLFRLGGGEASERNRWFSDSRVNSHGIFLTVQIVLQVSGLQVRIKILAA